MKEQLGPNINDLVANRNIEGLETMLDEYFENNLTEEEKQTCERDGCDQKHGSLGKELSMREIQVYKVIQYSNKPIQASEISGLLFDYKDDVDLVRIAVSRIRKKLGSNAIITDENIGGYISRDIKVEEEHFKNSFLSMLEESIIKESTSKEKLVSSFNKSELAAMLDLYFINNLAEEEKQTRESDRSDQQKSNLGKKLSMREHQIYKQIIESGLEQISSEEIGEKVYGDKADTNPIWAYISRIRDKIGFEGIIYDKSSKNYGSRRVRIEARVF